MSIMTQDDHQIMNVSRKDLRSFGLIMGGMIILFFGLLIPWIWGLSPSHWPFSIAGVFIAIALAMPQALKSVYKIWMKIGGVLGWINTRILLGFMFFAIIFPIGVIMRFFRDPMAKKFDQKAQSYRIQSQASNKERLRNPY